MSASFLEPWDCDILKKGDKIGDWKVEFFLASGGFGAVYGVRESSKRGRRGALKIYSGDLRNDPMNGKQSIINESELLKMVGAECAPAVYCTGKHKGRPYFVMELMSPMSLEDLPTTDEGIRDLVLGIISTVKVLHHLGAKGWVHRDIKPENLARRISDGRIVLIDFGAAHEMDDEGADKHIPRENTQNSRGGKYFSTGTRGYAPPELLFRPCCDVFAIGRVIRDCFQKDVPIVWSLIINRCISNRPDYRYSTIEELENDVLHIQSIGREEIKRIVYGDRVNSVREQSEMVKQPATKLCWRSLKDMLAKAQERDDSVYAGACQVLVDFSVLPSRHLSVSGHVRLKEDRFIVIKGPGVINVNLDAFLADEYGEDLNDTNGFCAAVVLLNNATLINTTRQPLGKQNIKYLIGDSCYLNFPRLSGRPEEESDFIITSNLGYSYVGYGDPKRLVNFLRQKDGDIEDALPLIYSHSTREVIFDPEAGEVVGMDTNSIKYNLLENDVYRQVFGMLAKCNPADYA